MTEPHLSDLLRHAVDDVTSSLDPHQAWAGGRRRHRRATALLVAGSVAASAVILGGVQALTSNGGDRPQDPAPSPTTTRLPVPSEGDTGARIRIDPSFDPADWQDLPEFPVDLGHWPSPDRIIPLTESPVDRATAAVSFDLGGGVANLSVLGTDDRWRSVDVDGLTFSRTTEDRSLGLTRESLSPDGTKVALGQPGGVVVIDLRTAERTTYPVSGLGPVWHGRETSWTADGMGVLIAFNYVAFPSASGWAYQPGLRVDLASGDVTELDYDPGHAGQLSDGTVMANLWREDRGHRAVALAPDGTRTALEEVRQLLGAAGDFTGEGQRWAIRREAMFRPDMLGGGSGFMVFIGDQPERMLPVKGVENNGGGGRVVGWVDGSTLLFSMPDVEAFETLARTVAWNVETGGLWKGPSILTNSRVSIARE